MNGAATHELTIIVRAASHRNYVEDKLSKKQFGPPIWRPLKISPPKVEKPTYASELYHRADFHADRREISVSRQKILIAYISL